MYLSHLKMKCLIKRLITAKATFDMLRYLPLFLPIAAALTLTAFVAVQQHPSFADQLLLVNSTQEAMVLPLQPKLGSAREAWTMTDPSIEPNILMFNYTAYDSAYANKLRRLIFKGFPNSKLADFWDGTEEQLRMALQDKDMVIVPYPANGIEETLESFSRIFSDYVRQGGNVLFMGTHKYATLRKFDFFELGTGYYCRNLSVHESLSEHPIFESTPEDFLTADVLYPMDILDTDFVSLAEVSGFPVVGYKSIDKGKVGYIGIEYYHDETVPTTILLNAIRWIYKDRYMNQSISAVGTAARNITRTEQHLYTGSGSREDFNLKIYPNPFASKATLDLDLPSATSVALEVADETGKVIATLLSRRTLQVATYHFEFPNVPPGIYFVRCSVGSEKVVRKVVKLANQ
jgi:hypothetical protein